MSEATPRHLHVSLAPDRMTYVDWPGEGIELYLEDAEGDGQIRAEIERRWQVAALIEHAAGAGHGRESTMSESRE
jgi:hypothetical protein